jgi:DNA-binding XRE family transcriptional regulator
MLDKVASIFLLCNHIKYIESLVNWKSMQLKIFFSCALFKPMITPAQCRAARALIEWSQQDLASNAGVGTVAIHQLENGASNPRRATLEVIRRALEAAGVEFIDENGGGAGVRLRKKE